jgi:hypothetical protein
MKNIRILSLLIILSYTALAQDNPNAYQNPFFNPSMILNEYQLNADLVYKQQLLNDNSIGYTTWANASYEVPKARSAFGLSYLNVQTGLAKFQNNHARLNYAFRFRIKKHSIVPAIYLGLIAQSIYSTKYGPGAKKEDFDVGVGLHYRFKDLIFGISMSRLNSPQLHGGFNFSLLFVPQLNALLHYDFKIGKMFRLMPVTLFQWNAFDYQIDDFIVVGVDSISKVLERVNLGVGLRLYTTESSQEPSPVTIVLAPEFIFKWFRIGYTLDWEISTKTGFSVMRSHQITLRMHLFRNDRPAMVVNGT